MNAFPLDMYQYDRLFSSTRIPKVCVSFSYDLEWKEKKACLMVPAEGKGRVGIL